MNKSRLVSSNKYKGRTMISSNSRFFSRRASSVVVIIQKAEFSIRLLGGYDWHSSEQHIYDPSNSLLYVYFVLSLILYFDF